MQYKLGVKTAGDKNFSFNMLRFDTPEEAQQYGDNLASRWLAVTEWKVFPAEDKEG